jgi:hypothetical protein
VGEAGAGLGGGYLSEGCLTARAARRDRREVAVVYLLGSGVARAHADGRRQGRRLRFGCGWRLGGWRGT